MLQVNSYFDDQIKSISFQAGKLPATVGVMSAGEYSFTTSKLETITVVSGALDVKLPERGDWQHITEGETFRVDANKTFQLKIAADIAYLCTYE